MAKLRIGSLVDERPVKISVELPASVHRDLMAYAAALAVQSGEPKVAPERLIAPMLERFMLADRAFTKQRKVAAD